MDTIGKCYHSMRSSGHCCNRYLHCKTRYLVLLVCMIWHQNYLHNDQYRSQTHPCRRGSSDMEMFGTCYHSMRSSGRWCNRCLRYKLHCHIMSLCMFWHQYCRHNDRYRSRSHRCKIDPFHMDTLNRCNHLLQNSAHCRSPRFDRKTDKCFREMKNSSHYRNRYFRCKLHRKTTFVCMFWHQNFLHNAQYRSQTHPCRRG